MKIYYNKKNTWFPLVFPIVMLAIIFLFLFLLLHGLGANTDKDEVVFSNECSAGDPVFITITSIDPVYSRTVNNNVEPSELYCKATMKNGSTVWVEITPYLFRSIPGSSYEMVGQKGSVKEYEYYKSDFNSTIKLHGHVQNAKALAKQLNETLSGEKGIFIINISSFD